MRLETKFTIEAANAEKTANYLLTEPTLRDRVSVPFVLSSRVKYRCNRKYRKVHWDKTTDRIMTADFVQGGCRLNEVEKIKAWGFKEKDVMLVLLVPVLIDADNVREFQASCYGMFRCHDLQYVLFKTR